jgi:hypothetical protein
MDHSKALEGARAAIAEMQARNRRTLADFAETFEAHNRRMAEGNARLIVTMAEISANLNIYLTPKTGPRRTYTEAELLPPPDVSGLFNYRPASSTQPIPAPPKGTRNADRN